MARVAKLLRVRFDDDTVCERLGLDAITTAGQPPPGTQHARDDLRGGGLHAARGVFDSVGSGSVAEVVDRFRPLGFGAAYKIIDILVELAMRVNNAPCPKGRWTFVDKQSYLVAGPPARLPIPLQVPHGYWPRVSALYDRFLEPRHALVHRRATLQPDGTLATKDSSGAALPPISRQEQDAFVHLARELALAVIAGHAGRRRRNRIAWELNMLKNHHDHRKLQAHKPRDVIREVIVDLAPVGTGRWKLDGHRVQAHLCGQNEAPFNANLVAYGTKDALVTEYRAICDEVPDGDFEFDESCLPVWLRRM